MRPNRTWTLVAAAVALLLAAGAFVWWRRSAEVPPEIASAAPSGTSIARPGGLSGAGSVQPALRPVAAPAQDAGPGEQPLALILGSVVSAKSGEPVGAAELTFQHGGAVLTARTGADGRFEARPTQEGLHLLSDVRAPGYLPFTAAWGQSPIHIEVARGEPVSGLVIRLEPATRCDGQVLAPDGRPVPGAVVEVLPPGDAMSGRLDPLATDSMGRFAVDVVPGAIVQARHADYRWGAVRVTSEDLQDCRLEVQLEAGSEDAAGEISGRVVDVDGSPADGAIVVAAPAGGAGPTSLTLGPSLTRFRTVALDGQFTVPVRSPTPVKFRVWAVAPGAAPTASEPVPIGAKDVEIRLKRGSAIYGRVRSASGEPVRVFSVQVSERRGLWREGLLTRTFLSPDGRYEISGVPAGKLAVMAVAPGHSPSGEVSLTVPDEAGARVEASFTLPASAQVLGRVVTADAKTPIPDVDVALESQVQPGGSPFSVAPETRTDSDGRFLLDGVGPTPGSMSFDAKGYRTRIYPLTGAAPGSVVGPLTVELTQVKEGEDPGLEFAGIGAVIGTREDELVVQSVLPEGGAAQAGLRPGDVLLEVDRVPVSELGFYDSIQRMRGPEGTLVWLRVRRAASSELVIAVRRLRIVSR